MALPTADSCRGCCCNTAVNWLGWLSYAAGRAGSCPGCFRWVLYLHVCGMVAELHRIFFSVALCKSVDNEKCAAGKA